MLMSHNRIDLTGKTFGRLSVLGPGSRQGDKLKWRCLCSCGNQTQVLGTHLRAGNQRSCGCLRVEVSTKRATKHGLGEKARQVWHDMIERCSNPACKAYRNYGARGISVCQRWQESLENFVVDMGLPPAGMELDRINNDGNYEPTNCRWVTHEENCNNTRRSKPIIVNGKSTTIPKLARKHGINESTLYYRLKKLGWPVERALEC